MGKFSIMTWQQAYGLIPKLQEAFPPNHKIFAQEIPVILEYVEEYLNEKDMKIHHTLSVSNVLTFILVDK